MCKYFSKKKAPLKIPCYDPYDVTIWWQIKQPASPSSKFATATLFEGPSSEASAPSREGGRESLDTALTTSLPLGRSHGIVMESCRSDTTVRSRLTITVSRIKCLFITMFNKMAVKHHNLATKIRYRKTFKFENERNSRHN